ncbi:MAG TPA: DUF1800 domain-containing protein [Acidimicrobiales bacterium]|nr:DUF1800 domain-containing protein [Acidimicrobiales bacterium]
MAVDPVRSDIAHLYRRAGFGATAAELDALTPAGYESAVDALVAGLAGPDPAGDAVPRPTLARQTGPAGPAGSAARKAQQHDLAEQFAALQDWWLARMIATSTPLRERLALHWHDHFATAYSKVRDPALMAEQNDAFRALGGGGFEALTVAVAKGGAMVRWLDLGTDQAAHPNENFARELLELFTMGVGTYSQDDVTAAARAFTGWTVDPATGAWVVRPRRHDGGLKTFLGQTGDWGGTDIIHMAVTAPVSPRYVLARLWSAVAYPVTPADPVVSDLVAAYGPGLDLTAAVRAALLHPAFRSPASRTGLVKGPVAWLVGAARALGLGATVTPPHGGRPYRLAAVVTSLGQALFDPPNVGGWGANLYWVDTASAELRLRTAALLAGVADLSAVTSAAAADRPDVVARMLGVDGWGPTTAAALTHAAGDPVSLVAAALTAPEAVLA